VLLDRLQEHQYDKAETLLYAADEFLQYYLQDFDRKFKDAWKETVTKVKQQEIDDCMPSWGHSDMEALRYTDKEMCDADVLNIIMTILVMICSSKSI
jgi:hypothetical protein